MPDLPETGLKAVLEDADKFAADAKKVADAELQIAAADAKVTASSATAAKAVAATAHEAELAAIGWRKVSQEEIAASEEAGRMAAAVNRMAEAMRRIESSGAPNVEEAIDVLEELALNTIETTDDLEGFATQMEAAADEAERLGAAAKDAADDVGNLGEDTETTAEKLDRIAKLQAAEALNTLAGTAGRFGNSLVGMAQDAVTTTARLEELDLVLGNMAVQNNVSAAALREQVEAIRAQGIQADVAYNLVSQFVRGNLDLTQSSQLARVAQDAAVISMEDSSQALAGMLHGIMTLQPEVLRYRGIIVDLESEYRKWADANGRTVGSMTGVEKQAVALQATIEQGAKIAGTYESAMESASKQLRSFPRYINDLKAEMGESLLPVYSDTIFATKDLIKSISDLPAPIKATVAVTGTLTGGMLKGGASALSFAAQASQLGTALNTFGKSAQFAKLGVTGLAASLAALIAIGAWTYIKKQEEAQQAEAAQILINSKFYGDYVYMLSEAGLSNMKLSEEVYKTVKAHQEAAGAAEAQAEAEALIMTPTEKLEKDFKDLADRVTTTANQIVSLTDAGIDYVSAAASGEDATLAFNDSMRQSAGLMSTAEEAVRGLMSGIGGLVPIQDAAASSMDNYAQAMRTQAEEYVASLERRAEGETGAIEISKEAYEEAIRLGGEAAAAVLKVGDAYYQIVPAIVAMRSAQAGLEDEMERIAAQSGEQLVKAEQRSNDQILRADQQLKSQQADLWKDYQNSVGDIMADIAQVDVDLMQDIIEAEREAAQEREQIMADMAASIMDLERKLAQDIEDLQQETAQKREDALRSYEQSVQDAQLDFSRDMESLERDHENNMLDLAIEYWEGVIDLAQKYGEAAVSLQEKYAQERQAIEEKYAPDPGPTVDDQREALQQELAELEESEAGSASHSRYYERRKNELLAALAELKTAELLALEDRQAAEEEQLDTWLAEEQAKLDESYIIAAEKEALAFEQRKAEREIQYQQQLQDLRIALEREMQEIQIDSERRMAELQSRHEREKAEVERRTQEALLQLDMRIAEEKARLAAQAEEEKVRLAEQLAAEQASYADRQAELVRANSERKAEISASLEEEKTEIQTKAAESALAYIDEIEGIGPDAKAELERMATEDLGPALDKWEEKFKEMGQRAVDAVAAMMRDIENVLQAHSPSKWAEGIAESIGQGWSAGSGVLDQSLAHMQSAVTNFQAKIEDGVEIDVRKPVARSAMGGEIELLEAALAKIVSAPAAPVVPPASAPSHTETSKNFNLNYQGVPQEKKGLRSLFTMMEMASGG